MLHMELPPLDDSTYTRLTQLLHPAVAQVVELSILPSSSSPPTIHYDPDPTSPALAIPKSLLVACFLRARSILATAQPKPSSTSTSTDGPFSNATETRFLQPSGQDLEEVESGEIYGATSVLLLFEPNHQTAANWRKRRLLFLRRQLTQADLQQALRVEWTFITSLLTSPLPPHHAKSTTLWYHRLWLVHNFLRAPFGFPPFGSAVGDFPSSPRPEVDKHAAILQRLWEEELTVIMHAGDRHPRNYYGWRYARDLWRWILENADSTADQNVGARLTDGSKSNARSCPLDRPLHEGKSSKQAWPERFDGMRSHTALEVHRWCLQHPRDVSGWSFLAYLLHDLELSLHSENKAKVPRVIGKTRASNTGVKEEIISQTISFTQKYSWKGESLSWFLSHMAKG